MINNINYAEYVQNPFEILTEENIKKLEDHCKKAIYYERRKKKEHEITVCLLHKYKEQLGKIEKQNKIIEKQNKIIDFMLDDLDTQGYGKKSIYDSYKHRVERLSKEV